MRIIAGTAKGRRLAAPKSHFIRPVADKVKGAIYNILGPVNGFRVLDLFAGTGSVGLEAASRGASEVFLVDARIEATKLMQKNTQLCGLTEGIRILRGRIPTTLSSLLKNTSPFDLIFVDPPYDRGFVNQTLATLIKNKLIDPKTRIIVEHSPREQPICPGLEVTDSRKYGQTLVSFLKIQ